ncbi:uncharacterized protein LOC144637766 [Oculina patagonica]
MQELCDLEDECSGRRIVDIESLVSAIETAAVCKECKEGTLLLREEGRMGLASQMTFQSVSCGTETEFSTDRKTGRFYPINRSAVFAAKSIGRGYTALSKFCNNLDIPGPMAQRTFEKHSKTGEEDEMADISITIDGTWMKRGHSSLSWQTGKVIDNTICTTKQVALFDHDFRSRLQCCGTETIWLLKKDCVGHLQKRIGRRLRDLKNAYKGRKLPDVKTLGGKDRLTDKRIDLFQKTLRESHQKQQKHGRDEEMKRAIWAILYHSASSEDNPQHQYCPEGETSCCGWQRDQVKRTNDYKHKSPLAPAVVEVIKMCLEGATQNQNESLNSVVWSLCPKESFAGLTTVETACAMAVSRFNDGSHTSVYIITNCGLNP